jgi:hypothetical protein
VTVPCPCCGHDETEALRLVVAERREAWQEGVLEGFGLGWELAMEAAAERGRAA